MAKKKKASPKAKSLRKMLDPSEPGITQKNSAQRRCQMRKAISAGDTVVLKWKSDPGFQRAGFDGAGLDHDRRKLGALATGKKASGVLTQPQLAPKRPHQAKPAYQSFSPVDFVAMLDATMAKLSEVKTAVEEGRAPMMSFDLQVAGKSLDGGWELYLDWSAWQLREAMLRAEGGAK